ncbi:unnamed protein product [Cyclocybe aegerita]|uniref:E3 ubiquitin-protein ligase RNF220 middle domain-containing protein n=1 Tax=Cyclocybe aegerita TaxID=1973307 RepID=A0A8S0WVY6_CYCAE|nr:unnamed protein product [Cyclocybe aegerita]
MTLTIKLQGKKRALKESGSNAALSTPLDNEPPHPTKRPKRAETRQCPVCDEHIPLRLLAKHAELEFERVEEVIRNVGSSEFAYDEIDNEPGPSSRARRSAIKARKSMTTRPANDSLDQSTKTIQAIKRHRKQRNNKLKEMAREDEEGNSRDSWSRKFTGEEIVCPVCSTTVRGDQDILDAHVDACLAHEAQRQEAHQRDLQHRRVLQEANWDDEDESTYIGNIRGAGFHTRTHDENIDDEIDIDGDDQAMYGGVQFTEDDVVPVNVHRPTIDEDVEIEADEDDEAQEEQKTLRDLVAAATQTLKLPNSGQTRVEKAMEGTDMDKRDLAILAARRRGDKSALIAALEEKLKHLVGAPHSSNTDADKETGVDGYIFLDFTYLQNMS